MNIGSRNHKQVIKSEVIAVVLDNWASNDDFTVEMGFQLFPVFIHIKSVIIVYTNCIYVFRWSK